MNDLREQLREAVASAFSQGRVRSFVCLEKGFYPFASIPAILHSGSEADRVQLGLSDAPLLAKYLLDAPKPAGIVVRQCDALGVSRLIRDRRVKREDLYIVSVSCPGVVDTAKIPVSPYQITALENAGDALLVHTALGRTELPWASVLLDRCLSCVSGSASPDADVVLEGEKEKLPAPVDYSGIDKVEHMTPDERYAMWEKEFAKCIRCFACRNACPACSCRKCSLDLAEPEWLSPAVTLPEQFMFHFTRAYHVAGRCVGCGECERACPVGLPLMKLNRKFTRDIETLFGVDDARIPRDVEVLGTFLPDDPEEFC
ncbi:MAG: 4Fe-4S dicluster domain-containing protein [Bacillota bacterium]